jgi:hypothetical protein
MSTKTHQNTSKVVVFYWRVDNISRVVVIFAILLKSSLHTSTLFGDTPWLATNRLIWFCFDQIQGAKNISSLEKAAPGDYQREN